VYEYYIPLQQTIKNFPVMKSYQNKLDRFRSIAKKLVDEHSAEYFSNQQVYNDLGVDDTSAAYKSHLDSLSKQLEEQAQYFVMTARAGAEAIKQEISGLCRKYMDQFVQRNQPTY